MFVYLDNSATTKPYDCVREAVNKVLTEDFGNPSALHGLGFDAEKLLNEARRSIAASIGASPREVYFSSCGSESDNAAIFGAWRAGRRKGKRIICTAVEHPAVLECFNELAAQGADAVYLPVNKDGSFNMDALKEALNEDTVLVSIMHVNNETGAIFPLEEIAKVLKKYPNAVFHSDCVQSYGKLDIDVGRMGVDMISLSGHKVHGPKGIGALYIKSGLYIPPHIYGGGQENGFRSGTENMPGIVGFGAAAAYMNPARARTRMNECKKRLKVRLEAEIDNIKFNSPEISSPSILNISFLGCRAEVLLHMLDRDGICVSTRSACSSKGKGSHVLHAMKCSPEEIEGAIRFSFSEDNTEEQMDYVVEKLKSAVENQRNLRSAFKKR